MKHEIEVQFVPGDTVWHKNLATNKAMETKVKSYQAIIYSDGGAGILYPVRVHLPATACSKSHENSSTKL